MLKRTWKKHYIGLAVPLSTVIEMANAIWHGFMKMRSEWSETSNRLSIGIDLRHCKAMIWQSRSAKKLESHCNYTSQHNEQIVKKLEFTEEKTEMIDELQLYIPRSNDGWFYVKMMSDPETMAYNAPWFPPDGCVPDPDSGWVELQKSWIGKAPERFYAFLQRKTDGAFVGDVNYHHNPKQSWCDMGIVIFAPERGKGYGKQGLRLLLDRAFKVDGVSCLHNDFEDARIAAYRIHKAVGFRETGTLDRIIHLELTREDYLKGISVCCDK